MSKYKILDLNLLNVFSARDVILLSLKLNIRKRNIFSNGVPSMLHSLLLSNCNFKKKVVFKKTFLNNVKSSVNFSFELNKLKSNVDN